MTEKDKEIDQILEEIRSRKQPGGDASPSKDEIDEAVSAILKENEEPIPVPEEDTETPSRMPNPPADEPLLGDEAPDEEASAEVPENEAEEGPAEENAEVDIYSLIDEQEAADEEPLTVIEEEPEAEEAPEETDEPALGDADANEDYEEAPPRSKKRKFAVIIISAIILVGILTGVSFAMVAINSTKQSTGTAEVVPQIKYTGNVLTGENDVDISNAGRRPVAVVVENEYSTDEIRPQWGLNSADIVLEGECEFSTRLLLFYADYSKMPSQIGPVRSARPPFIRFSEMFDAVVIHDGASHSNETYEGADTVFENDRIDHVDLISFEEDGRYIGRDYTRTSKKEHTAFFNGSNTMQLLDEAKIGSSLMDVDQPFLDFNDDEQKLSESAATSVKFRWSDKHCKQKRSFSFDEEKAKYTTTDFDTDNGKANLEYENLIFLFDETEYIKSGKTLYCNYLLKGGDGVILSEGTSVEIKWSIENGRFVFRTADGKTVKLNPGKSYIGYGSSNNGGKITVE